METNLLGGTRLMGPLTNIPVAAIANSVLIFQLSTFANMIGTKTYRLLKVRGRNNNAGIAWLSIGTGLLAAHVAIIPLLRVLQNMDFEFPENGGDYNIEVAADMTAWADVIPIDVQVEVEEIG